jgi:RHS repeat-associated protein
MTVLCDTNTGVTPVAPPNEEMIVAVADPQGDVTEHYYSVWPDVNTSNPDGFDAKEYSLPFSRRTASAGSYLSERLYSAAGYAATPRQPLRSVFVRYDIDAFTGCTPLAGGVCQDTNRRVTFERTVDHDDGGRVADTTYSDFDGLGHFRSVRKDGTFTSGNSTTVTAFNRIDPAVNPVADDPNAFDSGTYPSSFNLPPVAHPWVLNTYPTTTTTSDDDLASAKTFSCFDAATGVLRARRAGTGSSGNDLLAVFTTDHGDMTMESNFGGDLAHDAPVAASLCGIATAPPAQAGYRLTHTYTTGIRATSAYAGVTFQSLNVAIDAASGATMSSRDPGFVTTYSYDTAFRLTGITPPAGLAATTYAYASGSGFENGHFTPAKVLQTTLSGTSGTVAAEYQYDALGRIWREKHRLPDTAGSPVWNVRETLRSAAGYVNSVSAPEQLITPNATESNPAPTEYDFTPAHQTSYGGYDPLGRPSSITAPDGHVTTLAYKGSRSTTHTVSVATGRASAVNGEESVASTELHDRQGRTEAVIEAQVPDLTDYSTATSYRYDAWGHLASVSMPSGLDTQLRLFSYDARGLLVSEQHPEIGHTGNGTIIHSDYDSRGNAHRQVTGGTFDRALTFDSAERVTGVNSGATNLKTFVYDDQSGVYNSYCNDNPRCQNKIAAAARWNNLGDLGNVPVSEAFQYEGPGGLMTRRDIAAGSTMTFDGLNFAAAQTYNDLGQPYSLTYPFRKDASGEPLAGERARTVQQAYANGFLSAVTEPGSTQWASSINYHSSGLLKTIAHGSGANAATETWDAETTGIPRVARITATAANGSPAYDSGAYAYDGAGNIRTIGSTTLTYDFWGRLETSSDSPSTYTQHFYDRYGNRRGSHLFYRTPPCHTDATGQHCLRDNIYLEPVDGTTNHYLGASYDDADNVTADGNRSFAYDALNMMTAASVQGRQFRYLYTADDERIAVVERVAQPDSSVRNRTSWTLRGLGPHLLTVWTDDSTSGTRLVTWKEDEVWRGECLLGSDTGSTPRFYTLDHLGSPRRIFSSTGLAIGSQDYSPFGTGGTSNGGTLQFTGQERDANLVANGPPELPDSFHARMYDAGRGRFLSVDPGKDWDLRKPQSWNMYSYVRNNPINLIDPTGQFGWHDLTQWISGARQGISQWWHDKWHNDIPSPPDRYGAVEALKAADLSDADAEQLGNPQANWANARAEAGATISDEATEEVMSWGVGKVAGAVVGVIFGHGARHIIGSALEKQAVEAAIEKEIQFVSREATQTGSFWGRINMNGTVVEYRAFTLPDGTVNVGTYYTLKP